jgi:RimJ/RimL family protein N-acetyltransferase
MHAGQEGSNVPTDAAPILRDFPDRFETARLLIRGPLPGDGAETNLAIAESLEDLRPWMPWAQRAPTLEETETGIRRAQMAFLERSDLRLQLLLKRDGSFVGGSGLHRIDWRVPRFEIGYWCRRRCQGRGYITEAVVGIARFAFDVLGAERVEIRCDSRNDRSRRVAERAGFVLEAVLRRNGRSVDGTLTDTLLFALLRAEYGPWREQHQGGGQSP